MPRSRQSLTSGVKLLANALQLRRILLVGVFDDRELLRVGVVARIDPDLLDPLGGFHRGLGFEMDVRHDRHMAAPRAQSPDDVLQIGRVLDRRRGDAHDLATDLGQLEGLRDRGLGVHRVAGDHRLDANRVAAADADLADHHFARQTRAHSEEGRRNRKAGSYQLVSAARKDSKARSALL